MADGTLTQGEEVEALTTASNGRGAKNRLEVAIQKEAAIPGLSTEFAKAYAALGSFPNTPQGAYALVYNNNFPPRLDAVTAIMEVAPPYMQRVLSEGKLIVGGKEHYGVVLEKPLPHTLDAWRTGRTSLDDSHALQLFEKITYAVLTLHEQGIVHGAVNPARIYCDPATGQVMLGECISNFCGYDQLPAYDAIDQLTCHPAAKGQGDYGADMFALGMVALFLFTGKRPFDQLTRDQVLQFRMEQGSCDAVIILQQSLAGVNIPNRVLLMLRGLLTDHRYERWGAEELRKWLKRSEMAAPLSKVHKQGSTPLEFNEQEYISRKHLAADMARHWAIAQKSIRVNDLSRWVNLSLKQSHIGEALERSFGTNAHVQPMLTDERLSRILMMLDPEGPIRYQQFAGHIDGLGTYLAYCYLNGDRKGIQQVGMIIGEGMVSNWIEMQPNPRDYGFSMLGWSPSKVRQYIRKAAIGFGMERCLYELNPGMPCQSALVDGFHVTELKEVLEVLEQYGGNKTDHDPVDRHIGAFIAARINLTEEIRIKSLKNFPYVGKNPQVLMVGLLTVAQSEAHVVSLPKLTAWMETRLTTLIEALHSKGIRKNMQNRLRSSAKEGKMSALFKEVSDTNYARRDLYGFHEARQQYRMLGHEIIRRGRQSNIERMAYNVGLRISVIVAYLICAVSALYAMIRGG